jgi:hypothetical protein
MMEAQTIEKLIRACGLLADSSSLCNPVRAESLWNEGEPQMAGESFGSFSSSVRQRTAVPTPFRVPVVSSEEREACAIPALTMTAESTCAFTQCLCPLRRARAVRTALVVGMERAFCGSALPIRLLSNYPIVCRAVHNCYTCAYNCVLSLRADDSRVFACAAAYDAPLTIPLY